ncbi:MAG: CAP domain-containing protein [Actinobacteria bacterium]|nr:CAP domain-containing protein [Actinomycetota bacterium]
MRNLINKFSVVVATLLLTVLLITPAANASYLKVLGSSSNGSEAASGQVTTVVDTVKSDVEVQIIDLMNQQRAAAGLKALAADGRLTEVARLRSSDMIVRSYFGHYNPEGKNVFNLMKAMGIKYKAAGENLAQGGISVAGADAVMVAWMNSSSHAANILQSKFGKVGVGVIDNGGVRTMAVVFSN